MLAKDGSILLELNTISLLKKVLIPQAHLITPNLFEAEVLLGEPIKTMDDMVRAAQFIGAEFNTNLLVKGGHLEGDNAADVFYSKDEKKCHWFYAKRVATSNTHGTGCSLSSAIASYLAQGFSMQQAIGSAKHYLSQAINSGKRYSLGKGQGPIDHFYFLGNRNYDSQQDDPIHTRPFESNS